MPFLADIDQAPDPRGRRLLVGVAIAVPVCLLLGWLVLPRLRAALMSAAADHDRLARERDAFMGEICGPGMKLSRDEKLCGCVLATEYPGLDCLDRFSQWLTDQQGARCDEPATFDTAPGYCSCVLAVREDSAALDDEAQLRARGSAFPRCAALPDALGLPELQSLVSSFGDADQR